MIKSRIVIFALLFVFLFGNASAYFSTGPSSVKDVNTQSYPYAQSSYSRTDLNTYWPVLNEKDTCDGRQDILLQIAPAGCQPTVVRSDLLGEQNVPVLCQLDALEVNPLIDIKTIDSISFRGNYPKEVVATGFYPARAALSNRDSLLGDPLINNIGYVTVVLRKNANESSLPESVTLNLTARIKYDAYNALGIGQASFILSEQNDEEYQKSVTKNNFWQGRYSIQAEELTSTHATITIYYQGRKLTTVRVERGKESQDLFVPGFSTCQAKMKVAYDGFEDSAKDRATIEVSDSKGTDVYEVYSGTRFANNKCSVSSLSKDVDGDSGRVRLNCGGKSIDLSLNKQTDSKVIAANQEQKVAEYNSYVQNALEEYQKVIENYPSEIPTKESQETYGEIALKKALDLTYNAGLDTEYQNLLTVYEKNYPQTDISYYVNRKVAGVDRSNAVKVVEISGNYYTVKLIGFTNANKKPTASFSVGGNSLDAALTNDSSNPKIGPYLHNKPAASGNRDYERITLVKIEPDQVTVKGDCPAFYSSSREFVLGQGDSDTICGKAVRVNQINSTKLGVVRIIPNIQNTETETNLTVKIGIEKRAIQLSPEKAQNMVDNLNKSIQKWESISNSLSDAVTGLKTACFATAAALTAKNFLTGLDGGALARKKAMEGDNGWSSRCLTAFRDKQTLDPSHSQYVSVDDCLRQNGDAIEKDVSIWKDAIKTENDKIKTIEDPLKKSSALGSDVVDTEASSKAYFDNLQSSGSAKTKEVLADINSNVQNNQTMISYSDMKLLEINSRIVENPDLSEVQKEAARAEIERIKKSVDTSKQYLEASTQFKNSLASGYTFSDSNIVLDSNARNAAYLGATYKADDNLVVGNGEVVQGANIERVNYLGKEYIVVLSAPSAQGTRTITAAYGKDASGKYTEKLPENIEGVTSAHSLNGLRSKFQTFVQTTEGSYRNPYKNPQVRFHETQPYKGMPALVPIDTAEGWYAGTQQVMPVFGQQSTFQTSGSVSSFWLCNVGEDGEEEFEKSGFGGDRCIQFNFNTGQQIDSFGSLPQSKVDALIKKAIYRLNQAARQYNSGVSQVLFEDTNERVKVGNPAIGVTAVTCQNYMSAKECTLLFNLCDPVICPSSRCNFGGQYTVANVPETGIVGSALLCLPNAREGIMLPVCLTGLQTGVDGFVSIMKSHRDCLSEQLKTGKTVGICDQIYSVYMCEFFWKQAAPIANMVLPKIAETAMGQGTKGGGEYLTVMNAWQQTQASVSYFTQQYAVNSMQAFKVRSVAEAGGEFCKAFASIKAPSSLKSLVEPDSPPQFHAYFSSTKFNDITVPATSQYKVFYHIFAGKDTGVSYQVYLKNTDGTSYYNIPQTVMVSTGFIASGEYASQTKDFTAPEGYKELCVRVNGREECGFQQVSTSFAVNYLTDSMRSNELTRTDITSQSECTSGSVGSSVSLSLNLQSTVESTLNPEVYKTGIIRICATENPGGTTSSGRYKQVGYCDSDKVGCWLDTESVSRSLTEQNVGIQNQTLSKLNEISNAAAIGSSTVLDDNAASGKIDEIKKKVESLKAESNTEQAKTQGNSIVKTIENTESQVQLNHQKAELNVQKGEVYSIVAEKLKATIDFVERQSVVKDAKTTKQEVKEETSLAYSTYILEDSSLDEALKSICFVSDYSQNLGEYASEEASNAAILGTAMTAQAASNQLSISKETIKIITNAAKTQSPGTQIVNSAGKVIGTVGENGAVNLGGRVIAGNVLSKLSASLVFYQIFCTGYETQYSFNKAYEASVQAQDSANKADNQYWTLVFAMAKQSKIAENNFNNLLSNVEIAGLRSSYQDEQSYNAVTSCLSDFYFESAKDKVDSLSLRSKVILDQYRIYYDNSDKESSGFWIFKTESKITLKEGQNLQAAVGPFRAALEDTNKAVKELTNKFNSCMSNIEKTLPSEPATSSSTVVQTAEQVTSSDSSQPSSLESVNVESIDQALIDINGYQIANIDEYIQALYNHGIISPEEYNKILYPTSIGTTSEGDESNLLTYNDEFIGKSISLQSILALKKDSQLKDLSSVKLSFRDVDFDIESDNSYFDFSRAKQLYVNEIPMPLFIVPNPENNWMTHYLEVAYTHNADGSEGYFAVSGNYFVLSSEKDSYVYTKDDNENLFSYFPNLNLLIKDYKFDVSDFG